MRTAAAALLLAFALAPSAGAAAARDPAAPAIEDLLSEAGDEPAALALSAFYAARDHRPVWFAERRPTPRAESALRALETLDARGLDPADYAAGSLRRGLDALEERPLAGPETLASLELGLTASLLRASLHLEVGRVDPSALGFHLETELPSRDPTALAGELAAPDTVIAAFLDRAEPSFLLYRRARSALRSLLDLARLHPDWPALPRPREPIRPGDTWPSLPLVAERLAVLGDLPLEQLPAAASAAYRPTLERAVRRFQDRHGLEVDGAIGTHTLAALDVSPAGRAEQVGLSLERWRWLPRVEARRLLVVNVPAFRVHGLERRGETSRETFGSRVIVGREFTSRRTPVFARRLRRLIFSPNWEVPPALARRELVPKLRRDPEIALRMGYVVETPSGRLQVSPETLDLVQRGQARLRQLAGPLNAMGGVKFLFPNAFNVYLHGTSEPELFERTNRALSHGCVRVEDTEGLAAWVLATRPGWTRQRICEAMVRSEPELVELDEELWVFIVYATASLDADGIVHFHRDLYGHDERLREALERVAD